MRIKRREMVLVIASSFLSSAAVIAQGGGSATANGSFPDVGHQATAATENQSIKLSYITNRAGTDTSVCITFATDGAERSVCFLLIQHGPERKDVPKIAFRVRADEADAKIATTELDILGSKFKFSRESRDAKVTELAKVDAAEINIADGRILLLTHREGQLIVDQVPSATATCVLASAGSGNTGRRTWGS